MVLISRKKGKLESQLNIGIDESRNGGDVTHHPDVYVAAWSFEHDILRERTDTYRRLDKYHEENPSSIDQFLPTKNPASESFKQIIFTPDMKEKYGLYGMSFIVMMEFLIHYLGGNQEKNQFPSFYFPIKNVAPNTQIVVDGLMTEFIAEVIQSEYPNMNIIYNSRTNRELDEKFDPTNPGYKFRKDRRLKRRKQRPQLSFEPDGDRLFTLVNHADRIAYTLLKFYTDLMDVGDKPLQEWPQLAEDNLSKRNYRRWIEYTDRIIIPDTTQYSQGLNAVLEQYGVKKSSTIPIVGQPKTTEHLNISASQQAS